MNYNNVIEAVLTGKVVRATKYISPKEIIRATRTRFHGKITNGNIEISLTIGRPNYLEREFIKLCQKSGEPFPVKKIQLKLYNPTKKKNLKPRPKTK